MPKLPTKLNVSGFFGGVRRQTRQVAGKRPSVSKYPPKAMGGGARQEKAAHSVEALSERHREKSRKLFSGEIHRSWS